MDTITAIHDYLETIPNRKSSIFSNFIKIGQSLNNGKKIRWDNSCLIIQSTSTKL